jgi:hypothetical protein
LDGSFCLSLIFRAIWNCCVLGFTTDAWSTYIMATPPPTPTPNFNLERQLSFFMIPLSIHLIVSRFLKTGLFDWLFRIFRHTQQFFQLYDGGQLLLVEERTQTFGKRPPTFRK